MEAKKWHTRLQFRGQHNAAVARTGGSSRQATRAMVAAAEQGVHLYAGRTLSGDDFAAATQAPPNHHRQQAEEDQLVRKFAQTLRDGDASVGLQAWLAMVSRAFPSWKRSILTESDLCHACSDHANEDGETPGQERAESAPAESAQKTARQAEELAAARLRRRSRCVSCMHGSERVAVPVLILSDPTDRECPLSLQPGHGVRRHE
jgi:hypothetical protein